MVAESGDPPELFQDLSLVHVPRNGRTIARRAMRLSAQSSAVTDMPEHVTYSPSIRWCRLTHSTGTRGPGAPAGSHSLAEWSRRSAGGKAAILPNFFTSADRHLDGNCFRFASASAPAVRLQGLAPTSPCPNRACQRLRRYAQRRREAAKPRRFYLQHQELAADTVRRTSRFAHPTPAAFLSDHHTPSLVPLWSAPAGYPGSRAISTGTARDWTLSTTLGLTRLVGSRAK